MSLYSSDNPVFASFCFYGALLGAKTLSMAFLTAKQRFAKKVTVEYQTKQKQLHIPLPVL
jgi:glutathione S-transferase